ncbi:peptidylprolyl isomerase [Psychroserpens sp. BH13MA-6]
MLKILLTTSLFLLTFTITAQNDFEQSLDSIQTLDDVNLFFKKNKTIKGKVIVFNEEKHKTSMALDILKMGLGSKKYFKDAPQKTYYKVIDKYEIPYYRVSCVFLDGEKMAMDDIEKLRTQIISKYQQGYRFTDLARLHSMNQSAKQGGDLGWLKTGDMHPDFETAITDTGHAVGDIFLVDIPETKSYYVILKTHDSKLIKESKVLKVTEPSRR